MAASLIPVDVEVCVKASSTARLSEVKDKVASALESLVKRFTPGMLELEDAYLRSHVSHVRVADFVEEADVEPETALPAAATAASTPDVSEVAFWRARPRIWVYQLSSEGPAAEAATAAADDPDGASALANYTSWELPATEFEGMWESLILPRGLKSSLLSYAATSLLFADAGVNQHIITANRVILLHGPPGTGKTSLAKALAHKLSIRLSSRFPTAQLIEINAHSLFSRWFSESGKLVSRLFAHIREIVEDDDVLVFLLIDEVESLTAARKAAMSGGEPSDAVRVVNAVLTSIDSFRSRPNCLLITTSNLSGAIDVAFVDRADIRAHVGLPSEHARFDIVASCVREMMRVGLVDALSAAALPSYALATSGRVGDASVPALMLQVARATEGRSGRSLRKLPLQTHAMCVRSTAAIAADAFLRAMLRTLSLQSSMAGDAMEE